MPIIEQFDLSKSTLARSPADRIVLLAHEVPKRIRFRIPSLKNNDPAAQLVGARVAALGGVASACVNPLTASLIVVYDGAPGTRARIFAALTYLDYRICSWPPAHASARHRDTSIGGVVAKLLIRKLFEDVVYVAVGAIL
jgi:hypothetical protein